LAIWMAAWMQPPQYECYEQTNPRGCEAGVEMELL